MNFKKFLIAAIMLCSFSIFSQEVDYNGNDTLESSLDSILTIPLKNTFYRDYGSPFLIWKERPKSVTFSLYNRWGQLYYHSYNPDFVVDADNIKNGSLPEQEVVWYVIKIVRPSGEEITIHGTLTYLGYWRCG